VLEWESVISDYLARSWRQSRNSVESRLTAMALIAAVRVCLERGAYGVAVAAQALHEGFELLERGIRDSR
jgi:hypothetical protein